MKMTLRKLLLFIAALMFFSAPGVLAQETEDDFDRFQAEKLELEQKLEKREIVVEQQAEQIKKLNDEVEDHKRRIQNCSVDPSLAARIVCYDEIARDLGFKTAADIQGQEERMGDHGFWTIAKKVNEMGDEVITLKVDSVHPVTSRSGMRRTPTFNIRCASRKTDVFLDWKSPLADHKVFIKTQTILYRIDSEKQLSEEWDLSQDNHAAFSPGAIEFVKKLTNKGKLVMIVTAYSDHTSTLVFPLQGFGKALDVLVSRCYNAKPKT